MTDYENISLPIAPITWSILGVLTLISYLISKLADLCFDHYLINYTNYEHRHMIKARFEGEMNRLFIFNKNNNKNKDKTGKISILPIVVNEIKRQLKQEKEFIDGESNKKSDKKLNEEAKLNSSSVKESDINQKKIRQIKVYTIKNSAESNLDKSNKQSEYTSNRKNSSYNIDKIYLNRGLTKGRTAVLTKQDESSLKKTEPNKQNLNNPIAIDTYHPYREKFIDKHKENKKKLISESFKSFAKQKKKLSTSFQNEYQNLTISTISESHEFKNHIPLDTINSSFITANKSSTSVSDTCSEIDYLYQELKEEKKTETEVRTKKKVLIKQSTVETTLSNEN